MAAVRGGWRPYGLNIREKGICNQGNIREINPVSVLPGVPTKIHGKICRYVFINFSKIIKAINFSSAAHIVHICGYTDI